MINLLFQSGDAVFLLQLLLFFSFSCFFTSCTLILVPTRQGLLGTLEDRLWALERAVQLDGKTHSGMHGQRRKSKAYFLEPIKFHPLLDAYVQFEFS